MSLSSIVKENCPHCNSEQDIEYYQTVNVTLEPNLKNKVLAGKLNSSLCANCNKEINIVSGLLYHDMQNRIMLELKVTDEEDEAKAKVMEEFKKNGYIYREVYTYPKLIDKINIFDNKLNDLVIEGIADKLKVMLEESLKHIKDIDPNIHFNVLFKKLEKGLFKKKIAFYCFSHPSQMMEMKYDIKNLTEKEKKNLFNIEILRN